MSRSVKVAANIMLGNHKPFACILFGNYNSFSVGLCVEKLYALYLYVV